MERAPRDGRPSSPRCGLAAWLLLSLALLVAVVPPARGDTTLWGERGTLLVPGGETVPARSFDVSFAGNAGPRGFVTSPAAIALGLTNRLEAGGSFTAWPAGSEMARGARLDVRLSLRWQLWHQTATRPALAFGIAADHLARAPDLQPSVALRRDMGPLLLAAQLGQRLPGRRDARDPAGTFYGAGAALTVSPSATLYLDATGATGPGQTRLSVTPGLAWSLLGPDPMAVRREALRAEGRKARAEADAAAGNPVAPSPADHALPGPGAGGADGTPPWAAALAARAPVLAHPGRLTFFVAGGPSFGGPESFRVFAGVQISTFDELLQDSDGDGIPDRFDRCPYEPEDYDGYEDEDGCPDHGAEVLRKLAEERARAAAAAAPRFTADTPRFRMRIPLGEVPAPETGPPSRAPMYAPLPPAAPRTAPPKTPSVPTRQPAGPRSRDTGSRQQPSGSQLQQPPGSQPQQPSRSQPPHALRLAPTPSAASSPVRPLATMAPGAPRSSPQSQRSIPEGVGPAPARARPPTAGPRAALEPSPIAIVVLTPASLDRRRSAPAAGTWSGRRAAASSFGGTVVAAAFARAEGGGAFAEIDRQEIERVLGVAAREGAQLLLLGRASRAELLPEAGRRAESVMLDAVVRGHVDPARIRIRINTVRADDPVIELAVSALRDGPPRPSGSPAAGPSQRLEPGEAGLRQVREALAARRGEMEGCLAPVALRLDRPDAQVPLRLAVGRDGRVNALSVMDGPYAADDVQECLVRVSARWLLPASDGGYDALALIATLGRRR